MSSTGQWELGVQWVQSWTHLSLNPPSAQPAADLGRATPTCWASKLVCLYN